MADIHHETSDVNFRGILGFGIGLVMVAVIIHFLVWLMFVYFGSRESQLAAREFPLAAEQQNRLPPEPRLQTNPRHTLPICAGARTPFSAAMDGWTRTRASSAFRSMKR